MIVVLGIIICIIGSRIMIIRRHCKFYNHFTKKRLK